VTKYPADEDLRDLLEEVKKFASEFVRQAQFEPTGWNRVRLRFLDTRQLFKRAENRVSEMFPKTETEIGLKSSLWQLPVDVVTRTMEMMPELNWIFAKVFIGIYTGEVEVWKNFRNHYRKGLVGVLIQKFHIRSLDIPGIVMKFTGEDTSWGAEMGNLVPFILSRGPASYWMYTPPPNTNYIARCNESEVARTGNLVNDVAKTIDWTNWSTYHPKKVKRDLFRDPEVFLSVTEKGIEATLQTRVKYLNDEYWTRKPLSAGAFGK
jgi:hypothetical protein